MYSTGEDVVRSTKINIPANSQMMNKENAFDMFSDINNNQKGEGSKSTEIVNHKKYLAYKQAKRIRYNLHSKLNILMSMGAVKKLLLVKTILKRIQLAKQLFMLEIESSNII